MGLLAFLKEAEKKYGLELTDAVFEEVALQRGVPHCPESCRDCMLEPWGDWVYCIRAREHVDHPRHLCPIQQICQC